MPNDCVNHVTVYADSATVERMRSVGVRLPDLLPEPPTGVPEHEVWGSDRFYDYALHNVGEEGIAFRLTTAWAPPLKMMELIARQFNTDFLKVDWSVEDGPSGIWVAQKEDGEIVVKSLDWDEGCLEERAHRFRKPSAVQQ